MAKQRAFTLIELLVVVAIIALLVGILLPALAAARRAARETVCNTNISNNAKAVFVYAADHRDRFATFSWEKNQAYNLEGGVPVGPFNSNIQAAAVQFTDLTRRYSPFNTWPYTAPIAYPTYASVIMCEYMSQKIPEPASVCPEDKVQLELARDPAGAMAQFPADPGRWIRSSYFVSTPFWNTDRESATDQIRNSVADAQVFGGLYSTNTGKRKLTDVSFPDRKVMFFDTFSRHTRYSAAFYTHPQAVVPAALSDGSVRSLKTSDCNPGGYITAAGAVLRLNCAYVPATAYGDPLWPGPMSNIQPLYYGQTLFGLKGIDFGSPEILP